MLTLPLSSLLLNQTRVRWPVRSTASQLALRVVKEGAVVIAGRQPRSPGQPGLKTPELPDGFRESIFKGQVRQEPCGVCDQLVHSSLLGCR